MSERGTRLTRACRSSDTVFRLYIEGVDLIGADGYPKTWHSAIKHIVRDQEEHRCVRCGHPYRTGEHDSGEWSSCDENCTHPGPIRYRFGSENWCDFGVVAETGWTSSGHDRLVGAEIEARWRILTVHHLNGDKLDCRWFNLAALCQRCHLTIQGRVKMDVPYYGEHSAWFRPYVAAYYAWRFLGVELSRVEVDARLDELLALEHRQLSIEPTT